MRNKRAVTILGLAFVIVHLAIGFAGFVAAYDPGAQNRAFSYAPPTRVHFVDSAGFHLRPFVYASVPEFDSYREDVSHEYRLRFFVRGESYHLLGIFPWNVHLFGVEAPARILLFGTDLYGRDEFSRVVYGGQISLAAGVLATFITLAIATIVGTISGYYGRWLDESLMGCSELFLSLPWLYFLIGVRAFLPLHLNPASTFLLLIAVIGAIGWARPARLVRGVTLSARNRNYVLAARGFGGSDLYLLRRHVLPEIFGVLLTQAALLVPQYVAAEATLSFFGLGISEPVPSWGNMLADLQQYHVLASYWWMLAPGAALVPVFLAYYALANRIQERVESVPQ